MESSPPIKSYIIWFSQRVGSTMLTQALEDTGVAGRPREWLNAGNSAQELLNGYGVSDADQLRAALWRDGATPNGVFGVKYGMTDELHRELTSLFSGLVPGVPDSNGHEAWEAFFPHCQHIFLTRRDKLRLAVSWWRAIASKEWHRPNRLRTVVSECGREVLPEAPSAADLLGQYNYNALRHLLAAANLREAAMQQQFERWCVRPYTIVYEDFINSYEPTIFSVLDFLQIPDREAVSIPPPAFDRLADEVSETWYGRFRHDLRAEQG